MKLIFKQRFMTWLSSYDIFDEAGNTVFTVESQASFTRLMHVRGANGGYLASVKQKAWAWRPTFEIYVGPDYVGQIRRAGPLFRPHYEIDYRGWTADGDFMGFDYSIDDAAGNPVALLSKELFKLTDTYIIEVLNPDDALYALLLVLAIDAEKASNNG